MTLDRDATPARPPRTTLAETTLAGTTLAGTTPTGTTPTSGTTNWTGVLFGFLLASLAAFQQFKLPPMLPEMLAEFGYPKTVAGSFMSIYAAIGLAMSFALGGLMARMGTGRKLAAAFADRKSVVDGKRVVRRGKNG